MPPLVVLPRLDRVLVGREVEQQVIVRLLARARVAESAVLVLVGEAGIGKTALLADAVRGVEGMLLLRAGGSEADRDVPFGGLLALLRPVLHLLEQLPERQAAAVRAALALDPVTPTGSARGSDRFAVGAGVLGLLSAAAEQRALAVVVDDAHLLDEPSAQALAFAARRLMADRVALLVAARSGEACALTDAGLPEMTLVGLDLAAARVLVTAQAPHRASDGLLVRLHRTSGGNPLALVELAETADELEHASPEAPLPVPAAVSRAFSRRALSLPPSTRTALLVAAVAGTDLALVARACVHLAVDVAALTAAEGAGLVTVNHGRVEFRHPLVSSALYADESAERRRHAHRAVAAVLPAHERDRRAWHLSAAAFGPDEAVAADLDGVALRAEARQAHSVAASALERAARLSEPGPARGGRLCSAGEAAWRAGQGERATTLAAEALETGPTTAVRTRVAALRGSVAARCGSLEQARRILVAAADEPGTHPDRAVELLAEATLVCFFLGETLAGLEVAARLDSLLAGPVSERGRVLGGLAAGMVRVVAGAGGTEQVRRSVEQLIGSPRLRTDPTLAAWQVLGPLWLREAGASRALVHDAVAGVRERVALGTLPFLLFLVGRDDATTNRWSDAEVGYAEGIRLARETGQTSDLAACLAGLGWLLARQGRADAGAEMLTEATELARRHGFPVFEAWSLFARGDCELALGRPGAAVLWLRDLERLLAERGILDVDLSPGPELTDVLLRLGRRPEAVSVARAYADRAVRKGQPWALARGERALGLTATEDEMDRHFEAAAGWHAQTLDEFETARTDLARGSRLRRARRRVEARPALARALETFDRLGATPWADMAAVEARATGQTARRRQVGTATELTAQERQIATMLAARMTTRQTAAAMFLSPKTVEYHLRHVYSKLGVGSRVELADRLAEPATEPDPARR